VIAGSLPGAGRTRLRTRTWADDTTEATGRVVIVHGLGEHSGRYAEFARSLVSRKVAVLAYDQRGHGESEGRRGVGARFEDFLDDLDEVLRVAREELPGQGDPVLLGHSLGGLVTLRYLQTRSLPVAGAVLSAPWLRTAVAVPPWKRAARRLLGRVAPDLAIPAGLDTSLLTRDPEKQREYEEDPLVHDRISAGLFDAAEEAQERALATPPPVGVPLLILVPLADGVADAGTTRRYVDALDGPVTVRLLEGFRHEPLNDVGRAHVYEIVVEWISRRFCGEPASGARVDE
jgi:alpha-beta hydrolase superfamily lysophospholipase